MVSDELTHTTHFQKGTNNKIAVVFSCPGQKEEAEHCPAVGQTGKNLDKLLQILSLHPASKIKTVRKEITITNAWPQSQYAAKTGRTEATIQRILEPANLARLERELAAIESYVLAFGGKASKAISTLESQGRLNGKCRVICTRHLSLKSLNHIPCPPHGDGDTGSGPLSGDKTRRRLEVIARRIIDDC